MRSRTCCRGCRGSPSWVVFRRFPLEIVKHLTSPVPWEVRVVADFPSLLPLPSAAIYVAYLDNLLLGGRPGRSRDRACCPSCFCAHPGRVFVDFLRGVRVPLAQVQGMRLRLYTEWSARVSRSYDLYVDPYETCCCLWWDFYVLVGSAV